MGQRSRSPAWTSENLAVRYQVEQPEVVFADGDAGPVTTPASAAPLCQRLLEPRGVHQRGVDLHLGVAERADHLPLEASGGERGAAIGALEDVKLHAQRKRSTWAVGRASGNARNVQLAASGTPC